MAFRKRKIRDEGDLLAVIEEDLAIDSGSDEDMSHNYLVVVACVALPGKIVACLGT
jgi:hypothetical protein